MFARLQRMRALGAYFRRQSLVERPCPVCDASDPRGVVAGDRDFLGIRTAQCKACGFVFSSPFYSAAVIEEFYRSGYRAVFKGEPDPVAFIARQRNLTERAEWFMNFLRGHDILPQRGGSVLDVGCAEGTLVGSLRENRPDLRLEGVEPEPAYARNVTAAHGIRVHSSLNAIEHDHRFDLVVSIHVLEHVSAPLHMLREIRQRMTPDGYLLVDVPDVARYASIEDLHLAHCNHFSEHTLALALERAGLRALEVGSHAPATLPASVFAVAAPSRSPITRDPVTFDPSGVAVAARLARLNTSRLSYFVSLLRRKLLPRAA